MNKYIYADNAATTPINPNARDEMLRVMNEYPANASSLHSEGRKAASFSEDLRDRVCAILDCRPMEIIFTSGGTESNVHALCGTARAEKTAKCKNHIIVSAIEHHSLINTAKALENEGFDVTYLPPDKNGMITEGVLKNALRQGTSIVSIGLVNNELGTIQDIPALVRIAHEAGALFHCDCVAAAPHMMIDVQKLSADMISLSGHKFGAPVGVGLLWIKSGIKPDNLLHGGSQQFGKRPGTVPLALWAGFVRALEENFHTVDEREQILTEQKKTIVNRLCSNIPDICVNGGDNTVGGIISVSFKGIVGEEMMMLLDRDGIAVSTGSACASGGAAASHVINSIGLDREYASGTIRLSFYSPLEETEIDYICRRIVHNAELIRNVN